MYVCGHCLMAIESREGNQYARKLSRLDDLEALDRQLITDEDGEECIRCEWCEDTFPVDDIYSI